jgi:hypothetical protein
MARHAAVAKKEDVAVAKTQDGSNVWELPSSFEGCVHDDGMITGRRPCSREGVCLRME